MSGSRHVMVAWGNRHLEEGVTSPWPDFELTEARKQEFIAHASAEVEAHENPTKMDITFWKYMVAMGCWAYAANYHLLGIGVQPTPTFCFERFGRTAHRLSDGRIIFIGGEHEDFYDPDFCIYNDVIVVRSRKQAPRCKGDDPYCGLVNVYDNNQARYGDMTRIKSTLKKLRIKPMRAVPHLEDIEIYKYPKSVFPPTDFHSSVLYRAGDGKQYIYIIGGLGYGGGPHSKETLTYRLDLQDYSIQRQHTVGQAPPPMSNACSERTTAVDGDSIVVSYAAGEKYVLSIPDVTWRRIDTRAQVEALDDGASLLSGVTLVDSEDE